ncbi:hypothetical protein SAMN04489844_1691 [Nocardioides exalbidus]|uniref:DUF2510 domain-containing protein n=1 Tax=Nocardioides exalbidus TaxID=402596 RepID=A0A1H4PU13_9ACTN|nr:CopG family transcriptional regulator [Nocardioides exalbidus]SEC10728.1 hypothetical protein SAMN04489844_1691 [Nocardioides exalbidus]
MNRRVGWWVQAGLGALFAVTLLRVPGGVFVVVAVLLLLVFRGAASRSGRQSGTDPAENGRAGARVRRSGRARTSVDLGPDVADRLTRLAGELVIPGGRSNDEVMRDATRVYAQLPPEVRAELAKDAPEKDGLHVEVSGPLGPAFARLMGLPPDVVAPGQPTSSDPAPTATAPGRGILAPSELTGYEGPLAGAVPEGWYRTADGSRERWYNGVSWTAHIREVGSGD